MLALVLVFLFIVVPIGEVYVIIQISGAIGWPLTLGLMLVDAILGSMLMRSQGRAAWLRFTAALREGRVPAREVFDGGLIIFGGALLMAPGFVTDVVGALFLFAPTRRGIRRWLGRRVTRGVLFGTVTRAGRPGARGVRSSAGRPGPPPPFDVEGTAVEARPPDLPR